MTPCDRWQPSDWCTTGHHLHQPHRGHAWLTLCDKHHAEVSDPPSTLRDTPNIKVLTDRHEEVTILTGPHTYAHSTVPPHPASGAGHQAHPFTTPLPVQGR